MSNPVDLFPHDPPTPIPGRPNYESIQRLHKQIKTNAKSVPTTIGGGNHGFLGATVTDVEYAVLSAVPFIEPLHPGDLHIANGTNNIQARLLENVYKQELRTYEVYTTVIQSLKKQIINAIHPDWLDPIRNQITHDIEVGIPEIFTHLYRTHGKVTASALRKREEDVRDLTFDPSTQLVDVIFTKVERLRDYANAAGAPYTPTQVMDTAYLILKNTGVFSQGIREWRKAIRRNPLHNNWDNFKTHYRQAQEDLEETGELTARSSEIDNEHVANLILQALREENRRLSEDRSSDNEPSSDAPPTESANMLTPSTTNTTANPDVVTSLLTNMLDMQRQLVDMQLNLNQTCGNGGGRGRGNGGRGGRGRGRGRENDNGGRGRRSRVMRYCWTHGWCTHDGAHCNAKANGHKDEATANNRMGGSTEGLPPHCI